LPTESLLIVGASARAAAFSALRAGLRPCCVDLFADVDLRQRCPVTRLEGRYPHALARFLESDLSAPWMYAGGVENWPHLVRRWARHRPLWGNGETALTCARDPAYVAKLLRSQRMPAPALFSEPPLHNRCLFKPRRGASGAGIRFGTAEERPNRDAYLQEFIEGESLALLFLGGGRTAHFLGTTRQLVGESWLHAAPFHYCGSIGPVDPQAISQPAPEELGRLLASACFLEGLFGVDGILRDGLFFPVEINPRYTASVEVLEYASGISLLKGHAHVFTHGRLPPLSTTGGTWGVSGTGGAGGTGGVSGTGGTGVSPVQSSVGTGVSPVQTVIGKAILFARADLYFPAEGPWTTALHSPKLVQELPDFADLPAAGERIECGKPILTFFACADSVSACEGVLRQIAADLDRWLYRR
jgi:predicted ATP-grasp superfamily ATP-dependent carboligase